MLLPVVSRLSAELTQAGREPGAEQQTDVEFRGRLPRRFEQSRRFGRAPGELLRHIEQQRQERRADTGA